MCFIACLCWGTVLVLFLEGDCGLEGWFGMRLKYSMSKSESGGRGGDDGTGSKTSFCLSIVVSNFLGHKDIRLIDKILDHFTERYKQRIFGHLKWCRILFEGMMQNKKSIRIWSLLGTWISKIFSQSEFSKQLWRCVNTGRSQSPGTWARIGQQLKQQGVHFITIISHGLPDNVYSCRVWIYDHLKLGTSWNINMLSRSELEKLDQAKVRII